MGQEFCKGCEDCTNFKNNEGDLSYLANKPLQNYNSNHYFANSDLDNSILNKTDFQNDENILVNNINNQIKNETIQITSLNREQINNDLNEKYYQRETEDLFKKENEEEEENKNEIDKNIIPNDNNNIFDNENNNKIEDFQERLKEIKRNYNSKIITKLFKALKEKKEEAHKIIYTEYASINDSIYFDKCKENELDVNLSPEKNYLYIGSKFDLKKDGLGLEIFSESNAKYVGKFINDKRVFFGKYNINNEKHSYSYYGEIKGLFAYGFGWSENIKESIYYEGMWINSKKEGYGIEKCKKDNSIYKGFFSNGKKNGIGQYIWSDNSNYMGEWLEGALNGYGIYHFPDGAIYSGSWENNRMNGFGEFTFPEIKTYLGFFEEDKKVGFGILLWHKEKKVFIGFWKDNRQNGLGKFINNNKFRYGIWENGVIKEKIQNEEDFIKRLEEKEKNYLYFFKYNKYEEFREKIENISIT